MWERLVEPLPDDAVLFANRRFTDRDGDSEADIVVAWAGVVIAITGVKGGHVILDRDGVWHQSGGGEGRQVDPVAAD